jgi:hypothetical protein
MTARTWSLTDHPQDSAKCYQCGAEILVYRGCLVSPPDPFYVRSLNDIIPVATCREPRCCGREMMRQDALFGKVTAPLRDAYFAAKAGRTADSHATT